MILPSSDQDFDKKNAGKGNKLILLSGSSSRMMAVVNNDGGTMLESNPSAISHLAMQPIS